MRVHSWSAQQTIFTNIGVGNGRHVDLSTKFISCGCKLTLPESPGNNRVGISLLQRRAGEKVREDEGAESMADSLWISTGWNGNQLTKHSLKIDTF